MTSVIRAELTGSVAKIRKSLIGLMKDANRIKQTLGGLAHDEISLRNAITVTLDDLERVDEQIRLLGALPPKPPTTTDEGNA